MRSRTFRLSFLILISLFSVPSFLPSLLCLCNHLYFLYLLLSALANPPTLSTSHPHFLTSTHSSQLHLAPSLTILATLSSTHPLQSTNTYITTPYSSLVLLAHSIIPPSLTPSVAHNPTTKRHISHPGSTNSTSNRRLQYDSARLLLHATCCPRCWPTNQVSRLHLASLLFFSSSDYFLSSSHFSSFFAAFFPSSPPYRRQLRPANSCIGTPPVIFCAAAYRSPRLSSSKGLARWLGIAAAICSDWPVRFFPVHIRSTANCQYVVHELAFPAFYWHRFLSLLLLFSLLTLALVDRLSEALSPARIHIIHHSPYRPW